MNGEIVIEAQDATVGYKTSFRKRYIVHKSLAFSLQKGTFTSMLGANGSGKSTLIKSICGFTPLISGDILLNGMSIKSYSKSRLSTIIGVVLTDKIANGGLTVYDMVSLGRYPHTGFFGRLDSRDTEVVEESIKTVGMWDMKDCFVSQLSDGERQKSLIAKAITQECPMIILDEPTAFLDIKSRIEIVDLLRHIAIDKQKAILMSTHDLDLALQYSDNIWLLTKHIGIECGNTEEMLLSGKLDKIFDGNSSIYLDYRNGSVRKTALEGEPIIVEGENENEIFWVKNALRRNGFCVDNGATSARITGSQIHFEGNIRKITIREFPVMDVCGVNCESIESMIDTINSLIEKQ